MAGVLTKAGLIKEGKVTEESWNGYVEDVKKMLTTGEGIFPSGVTCSRPVQPARGANALDLSDKDAFPDFHRIWRQRYENMVLSLDVPGDFQIVKTLPVLANLIDPTALAGVLGINPPKLSLGEALAKMLVSPPLASNPPAYFAFNFPDISPPDVISIIGAADFLKVLAPAPPIPPLPKLPSVTLFKLGYKEQFNFETGLALAPLKTHIKMMVPALVLEEMPGILAKLVQLDVAGGLISFICKQAGGEQPTPMSTSSFEIAAQQVLLQHQVKCQALGFVGQQIGAGVITNGLAATPFVNGGLGLIRKEEIVSEPDQFLEGEIIGPRRLAAGAIIRGVVPFSRDARNKISGKTDYDSSKDGQGFRLIAPSFSKPIISTGGIDKSGDDAWNYVDALKKVISGDTAQNIAEQVAGTVVTALQAVVTGIANDFGTKGVSIPGGINKYVTELKSMDKKKAEALLAEITKKSPIFATSRTYTTCGEMPRYLYSKMIEQTSSAAKVAALDDAKKNYSVEPGDLAIKGFGGYGGIMRSSVETGYKIKTGGDASAKGLPARVDSGGLATMMVVGRALEEQKAKKEKKELNAYRGTIWRILDPFCGAERSFWMDKNSHPKLGDAILTGAYSGSDKWGRKDNGKLKVDLSNVGEVFGKGASEKYFYLPGQRPILHVSIMYEWSFENGYETWTTVDAGQGGKENQGAAYKRKKVFRDPFHGVLVLQEQDTNVSGLSGQGETRIIMGWLDIDYVPELAAG